MKLFSSKYILTVLAATIAFCGSVSANFEGTGKKLDQLQEKAVDKIKEGSETVKDKAGELKDSAADKANEVGDAIKEKATDLHDKAKDKAHEAIDKI